MTPPPCGENHFSDVLPGHRLLSQLCTAPGAGHGRLAGPPIRACPLAALSSILHRAWRFSLRFHPSTLPHLNLTRFPISSIFYSQSLFQEPGCIAVASFSKNWSLSSSYSSARLDISWRRDCAFPTSTSALYAPQNRQWHPSRPTLLPKRIPL